MKLEVTDSGFEPHDEDRWYAGTLLKIEPDEGQFGPQLKWTLDLDEDDDEREQFAWCSQKLSPKSKLFKWIKGLTGRKPTVGEVIDVDQFASMRVACMFEQYLDGEGNTRDRVTRIVAEQKAFPNTQPSSTGSSDADGQSDDEQPF